MTKRQGRSGTIDVKALLAGDEEFLRPVLTAAARGVTLNLGRDEETAPGVEQRNYARCQPAPRIHCS